MPQCRMRGRLWILLPDALAIQPGGPLEASAGHGPERRQDPRKRTTPGSEVRTAAGVRLRFSAAARTQAPERPRLAGSYKFSLFCRIEGVASSYAYAADCMSLTVAAIVNSASSFVSGVRRMPDRSGIDSRSAMWGDRVISRIEQARSWPDHFAGL